MAAALGDRALAASADAAYVHGMDLALLACGGASVAAAVLAALFLPGTGGKRQGAEPAACGRAGGRCPTMTT